MATNRLPISSKEYLYLRGLQAFDPSSSDAVNPMGLVVQVALKGTETIPLEAEWKPAAWLTASSVRVLIGLGTPLAMTAGTYAVWLRVLGATERPERKVGTVTFTATG